MLGGGGGEGATTTLPDAVTDLDVWAQAATTSGRPVAVLHRDGGEDAELFARFFWPGGVAEPDEQRTSLDTLAQLAAGEAAVLIVDRVGPHLYQGLTLAPVASPPRRRTRPPTLQRRRHLGRNDVRRLARRGGVKRIALDIHDEVYDTLTAYLRDVLRGAIILAEHGRRRTIQLADVLHVLERKGTPMYR